MAFGVLSVPAFSVEPIEEPVVAITFPDTLFYDPDDMRNASFYSFFKDHLRFDTNFGTTFVITDVQIYLDGTQVCRTGQCTCTDGVICVSTYGTDIEGKCFEDGKQYTFRFVLQKDNSPLHLKKAPAVTCNGSSANVRVTEGVNESDGIEYFLEVGPVKINVKSCTCKCHIDFTQPKNILDFFRGFFFYYFRLQVWAIFKNKSHQYCECGLRHYDV